MINFNSSDEDTILYTKQDHVKPVLLRRPTPEPIHFTLPVAEQDPHASTEIDTPR